MLRIKYKNLIIYIYIFKFLLKSHFCILPCELTFNPDLETSRVMDCFLSEGIEVIFRLALALLLIGKQELLVQDIEGVIRVIIIYSFNFIV
jgi:hypothetical protein